MLDDVEEVLSDRSALGVLRSALWGSETDRNGQHIRRVTWNARGRSQTADFSGGIIMLANRRPSGMPELQALLTRISVVEFSLTFAEAAAEMRRIATNGYGRDERRLTPDECSEVVNFLIDESSRSESPLDLRVMNNAFEDRLQFEQHEAGCHWRDLVASRIQRRPAIVEPIVGVGLRDQARSQELAVAREICDLSKMDRLEVWRERTGKSQATMYRRLAELGKYDSVEQPVAT